MFATPRKPCPTLFAIAIAIVVAPSTLWAGPAGAANTPDVVPARGGDGLGIVGGHRLETSNSARFWTGERMRRADRRGAPIVDPPWARVIPPRAAPAAGPRTLVPPSAPRGSSAAATASSTNVADPSVEPYSTHGRLFFRIDSFIGSCSATVINTRGRNLAITAGHCLREGYGSRGAWSRHVVFVPAYENGSRPFGSFAARSIWVSPGYYRSENPNYDVGAVVLRANQLGKVANVVGARGWATGVSRFRPFQVFGYPAGSRHGEVPAYCDSQVRGVDRYTRGIPGPATSRIVCDMARGSSGGGWIFNDLYLNSVISYGKIGHPGVLYGPFFGKAVRRLIHRAR